MLKRIPIKSRKRFALFVVVVSFIFMAIVFIFVSLLSQKAVLDITSFQQCADAGYPIQESFPERCSVPGGKTFTNNE